MANSANPGKDFVIMGPKIAEGNRVLEAIHALYFLPENYRLVFTGSPQVDRSFLKEVTSLIERDELGHRVQFNSSVVSPGAVITAEPDRTETAISVTGDTPEALASAILRVARAALS